MTTAEMASSLRFGCEISNLCAVSVVEVQVGLHVK